MDQKRLTNENRRYFQFIDELKKNARDDSPTAEISRFYKEVADILSEAFEEYQPSDLPKYQDRLESIIKMANSEEPLKDPVFQADLKRAKEFLDKKVKERFGLLQKVTHLGAQTARALGGVSTAVHDFLEIGDKAAEAGRRVNQFTFGFGRRRLDPEEEKRQYDLLANPDTSSSGPGSGAAPQQMLPDATKRLALPGPEILPVKDDKLIGTNTEQNKVLVQLVAVSKDSNSDIKKIKNLLITDIKESEDRSEKVTLSNLEAKEEDGYRGEIRKPEKGLLAGLIGMAGQATQPKANPFDEVAGTQQNQNDGGSGLLGDALEIGGGLGLGSLLSRLAGAGKGLIGAAGSALGLAGEAATSPVGLAVGSGLAGYGAGTLANNYVVDPLMKKVTPKVEGATQSLAASIGEKTRGLDYYKQLFQNPDLDEDGQHRAEQWALKFLQDAAEKKRALFEKAYQNGAVYGDGSYQIDGDPQKRDDALDDVKAAEKKVKDYADYLSAKDKSNRALPATAKFHVGNNVYSNPLLTEEGEPSIRPLGSQDGKTPELMRPEMGQASRSRDGQLNDIPGPSDVDEFVNGLAAAETGSVTDEKGLLDSSRFIRTKSGGNSSAYGPVQITKSLAEGAVKSGMLDSDAELKKWTNEKFIPQGQKFLQAKDSDPRYGAGGQGDLTSEADRQMYKKLADALAGDALRNNNGDALSAAGEWRFGANKKDRLLLDDPGYAKKVARQIQRDQMMAMNQADISPVSQAPRQMAMNQLSQQAEENRGQPIVIPVPTPQAQAPQTQMASNVSTKSVGASSNGASEASLMLGIRHSVSPLT